MIRKLDRSAGENLGYTVSGDISKDDYSVLVPDVRSAVEAHGSVRLLLDLTDFSWEKIDAWGADARFGREFHDRIERMAIVGNKRWEQLIAKVASPFYARESKYFEDLDAAWDWLDG